MLAILLSLFYYSGIHAQSYSYPGLSGINVEYGHNGGMNQFLVPDDACFSTTTDPVANLTMDCLAANGYGQWTSSASMGSHVNRNGGWNFSNPVDAATWAKDKGWLLLGNLIGIPSIGIDNSIPGPTTTHPGCQPPGIVSGGKFTTINPSNGCMADANLTGSVRYVQIEPTSRTTFLVEGLNDERAPTSPEQQIDISLAGTNPNPPQIVTQPIFLYSTVSTGGHAVANLEADSRDDYGMCCDQSFLYITLVSQHGSPTHTEIWATVVDLFSGTVITAPFHVISDNTHNYSRPTINCDHRGAPSSPTFSVAFITDLTYASVGSYIGNAVQNGGIEPFIQYYYDPFVAKSTHTYDHYTTATHARVLVSSVAGSSVPVVGVYVITNDDLVLYLPTWTSANDYANYVDGAQEHPANYPSPIVSPSIINKIVDKYIVAFANPYDNQSGAYNQFHCLYQLVVTTPTENPLVLVRGFDAFCVYHIGGDTRVLLNRNSSIVLDDPDPNQKYVGAVNQMGIHVHWRTSPTASLNQNTHFYVRDTRSFDEPIEENSLITNVCIVADGSSHGGTSGAFSIGLNRKIAIWTDPNYGLNNSIPTSGLYFMSNYYSTALTGLNKLMNIGTLNFSTDASIGFGLNGTPFEIPNGYGPGNLYTAPNINISFGATGQGIGIAGGSTWDFYGTWLTNCFSNPANGNVGLNGLEIFDGDTARGFLNIHAGSQFFGVTLNANMSDVEILWDHSIYPLKTSVTANTNTTGILELDQEPNFLISSQVNSHLPYSTWVDEATAPSRYLNAVVILGEQGTDDNTTYFVHSNATNYSNNVSTGDPGVAVVLYDGGCSSDYGSFGKRMNKVVFENGSFNRMRFIGWGPGNGGLEVIHNTEDNIDANAILIQRNTFTGNCDYADIAVSNNTFLHILNHGTSGTHFDPQFGIVIQGFNNSSFFGQLNVNSNIFTSTVNDGNVNNFLAGGGIEFINSTGNIDNNTITDIQFGSNSGITITADITLSTSFPYLCGDDLETLNNGIISDHFNGYVNLCKILDCEFGYVSGVNDKPRIVFTKIGSISTTTPTTATDIEIDGSGSSTDFAEVDLTGVHGGTDDYSAKNSLLLTNVFNIHLSDQYGILDIGKLVSTWAHYGENNFVGTSIDYGMVEGCGQTFGNNNMDNNFWSDGSGGVSPTSYGFIIAMTMPPPTITFLSALSTFSVYCSPYTAMVKDSNRNPPVAPNLSEDSYDTCAHLKEWEYMSLSATDSLLAKQVYDTLRLYIEKCAVSDQTSYQAFGHLDAAVGLYDPNDTSRFRIYRDWLISVFYLNTTEPAYSCNCLSSIAGTYQYSQFPLAGLAILNYIRHISACYGKGLDKEFTKDSLLAFQEGYDPTHLPPLDSLGLGFLLKNAVHPLPSSPLSSQYLASFTSSPNPFTTETTLEFTLNRTTYITIDVYDELGRVVWNGGRGSSLEAGTHTIQIDGSKLPSGTLYARISTGFGEVKTVKLVHEK